MDMANVRPPKAEKRPRVENWHGYTKRDDYHWLKAENWQEVMHDPALLPKEIREFLEGENAFHEAVMADTKGLQETLFSEMKGRIKEDDSSVPAPDGPFDYYSSFVTGGQHPRYCRKPRGKEGPEELLLDGNELAKGRGYFRFGGMDLTPDHRLLAWSFDGNGSEFYEIRVRDTATGQDGADVLENTAGGAVWAADGKSFFYTLQDENHRPLKTFRHVLGTRQSDDALVYEEPDAGKFTGVGKTHSEKYVLIDIHDHDTSEIWMIDAERPGDAPRLIAPRVTGIEYDVEHWNDRLIIKTNRDDAEDYKIVSAPVTDGSLSSCFPAEAVTWGKVDKDHYMKTTESMQGDYSAVVPFIVKALLDNRKRYEERAAEVGLDQLYLEDPKSRGYLRPREGYRLFEKRERLMETLRAAVKDNAEWLRESLGYPLP
jgi:oligopeptidase B